MSKKKIKLVAAAGGIVWRYGEDLSEPEVLMIFRNGYWDLPKGKLEKNETIEMCAVREVSEEVGSSIPTIINKIGTSYHEYDEKGKKKTRGKTTHWYSMIFTKQEELLPEKEEGIEDVKWVPLSEAIEKAGFENLKEVLRSFRK
jgi:8-oxo-dGTP pyrophosphatase MutT (NUDIX family)